MRGGDEGPSGVQVLVAHPRPLLCEALSRALGSAPEIDVVASAMTLADLRRSCVADSPHVVLTAPAFPDGELVGALGEVLRHNVRVLVLCEARRLDTATPLLFAGASGCQSWQDCGADDLVAAVRSVAAGHAALHPAAAAAVLRQWRAVREDGDHAAPAPVGRTHTPVLTARERDVLSEMAGGRTTRTIAGNLAVSPKTVEAHITRILAKLGARNRAQAISVARELELLSNVGNSIARNERNERPIE
jgi:DNA-binding NarL/FixJ family response regulator